MPNDERIDKGNDKGNDNGYFKLRITTVMIFAGIIFLASLFSGWLTQSKDLSTVSAEQKIMGEKVLSLNNRTTVVEQGIIALKEDLTELKNDTKDIRRDQIDFYKRVEKKLR